MSMAIIIDEISVSHPSTSNIVDNKCNLFKIIEINIRAGSAQFCQRKNNCQCKMLACRYNFFPSVTPHIYSIETLYIEGV